MKEDLNMYGNELNYMDTTYRVSPLCFNRYSPSSRRSGSTADGSALFLFDPLRKVGYAIFLIPSQVILTKVRPSYWLPALEVCPLASGLFITRVDSTADLLGLYVCEQVLWGVLTALMAVCTSVQPMYALRFFIGVAEASSYPGIICMFVILTLVAETAEADVFALSLLPSLCSWYTPSELATRVAIFGTSYPAANIFVGFLQTALHESMDGRHGLEGYQWLFIINGTLRIHPASASFSMS
jgi:ACS family pantothenate transporter-like MFS transporter